jgi:hypothetical protein
MTPFNRHEEIAHAKGYRALDDGTVLNPRGKKLSPWVHCGYLTFKAGRGIHLRLHRVVAFQKFGTSIYEPGIVVRHKDGNPINNHPDNLLLGTPYDNAMDRKPEARRDHARKAADKARKYDHRAILEYLAHGSYRKAEKRFGCARSTLNFIKHHSLAAAENHPANQSRVI